MFRSWRRYSCPCSRLQPGCQCADHQTVVSSQCWEKHLPLLPVAPFVWFDQQASPHDPLPHPMSFSPLAHHPSHALPAHSSSAARLPLRLPAPLATGLTTAAQAPHQRRAYLAYTPSPPVHQYRESSSVHYVVTSTVCHTLT